MKQEEFLINLKWVEMHGKNNFERTVLKFTKNQLEFNKDIWNKLEDLIVEVGLISTRLETVIIKNNLKT